MENQKTKISIEFAKVPLFTDEECNSLLAQIGTISNAESLEAIRYLIFYKFPLCIGTSDALPDIRVFVIELEYQMLRIIYLNYLGVFLFEKEYTEKLFSEVLRKFVESKRIHTIS